MGSEPALLGALSRRDPERIGSFVLVGRLGAGAMGRVYLGRSAAGRHVAIKTIRPEFADESDFRVRFAREVAAARQVSGVFTAAVVAADPDAEVPWLATEYVPAPSLNRLVRECGPLPVPGVRWLAAGCAEALESIHGAGLVHRDLKPSNVLVAPDGPRVIDFGVARTVERIQLTVTRGAVGTPAYMAPEQARDTRQAVMASDVFSLGSTLLFAATGHAPYQGETVMDVLIRLATEPPDLSGLPAELADVIVRCLERDPRARPTPAAILENVAPYVDPEVLHEPGVSPLPDAAITLIEAHRRRPEPAPRATTDDEPTYPSHAVLPETPSAATTPVRRLWSRGRGDADSLSPSSLPGVREGNRFASVVVSVGVAAVLVVIGGVLGRSFSGGGSPSAPSTVTANAAPAYAPNPPPPGLPPPPLSGASAEPTGNPQIELNQPLGDGDTIFVVHGTGWTPGARITIGIAGGRTSPYTPAADQKGTFNYAVNQAHEFFPTAIPPGQYEVTASSDGSHADATFSVHPPP